jgi:aspartyl/asparaginyl-tRNA synthetase
VARLAGIPEKVVEREGEILQSLSPHDRLETSVTIPAMTPAEDVPVAATAKNPLPELLRSIDPNELSPRDALEILFNLVSAAKNGQQPSSNDVTAVQAKRQKHERYLCEEHFKAPTIVYNYPSVLKAFYMYQNDDGKTVRAMDLLMPGIGEVIGGSQREDREDVLIAKMKEKGLSPEHLDWYIDLRRFGGVPHSGFGMGLERLLVWITGMGNVRDVIPFPRVPGVCKF